MKSTHERLLRLPEVAERVGLRRTAIYERVATGRFPVPLHVTSRAVRWRESDIDAWIASRPSAREG